MTVAAVLAAAAVLCVASIAVGRLVWRRDPWLGGAVGLAALVAVADLAVELPGAGRTAAIVLLVVAVAAALAPGALGRASAAAPRSRDPRPLALAGVALAVAFLPFIAAGHVGILAVADNADFYAHTMLADAIRAGEEPVGVDPTWFTEYPRGPHSLAAAVAAGLGIPVDAALTGLLLAVLVMSVLAAGHLLAKLGTGRVVVGALIAGIPYLAASYTVQTSFKETLLGVFVLAWALVLPSRAPVPLLALAAGAWSTYGVVGLGWLGLVAVAYALLRMPRIDRSAWPRVAMGVVVVAVAVAALSQLEEAEHFVGVVGDVAQGETPGGNIRAELPAYQVFGAWPRAEMREASGALLVPRALALLAACAALWAAWWWLRTRRRPELPAAAMATLAVYAFSRATATPYYSGKALAIAAFAVGAMTFSALVLAIPARPRGTRQRLAAAAGVVVLIAAAWSSTLALRGAHVEPEGKRAELESLRGPLRGSPTLYLGKHNYAPWLLRGVPVGLPAMDIGQSQVAFALNPARPWKPGMPFGWENVAPEHLDRFRFAIAPRTRHGDAPPPNWRRVRTTRSYEVFRRTGPTDPAACAAPARSVVVDPAPHGRIKTGDTARATATLPEGTWRLSLQYESPTEVEIRTRGRTLILPASLDPLGPFWEAGRIEADGGPVTIEIHPRDPGALAAFRRVQIGALAATRPQPGSDAAC